MDNEGENSKNIEIPGPEVCNKCFCDLTEREIERDKGLCSGCDSECYCSRCVN